MTVVLRAPDEVAATVAVVVVVEVDAVVVPAASAATEVKEELDALPPVPLCNAVEDTVADEDKAVVAEIIAPTVSRCFRVSESGVVQAIDATASDVGDSFGRLVVMRAAAKVPSVLSSRNRCLPSVVDRSVTPLLLLPVVVVVLVVVVVVVAVVLLLLCELTEVAPALANPEELIRCCCWWWWWWCG